MWSPKRNEHLHPNSFVRRASPYVDRQFQLKYSSRSFWLSAFSGLLLVGPLCYLLNQNYSLIRELMFRAEPQLIGHLDREQFLLNVFLLAVFAGHLVFVKIFTLTMSAKIVGPLKKLRNRFRLLSRGEFSTPPLRVRSDDEFQDLVASFNYFYSGLQSQTERDLLRLKEAHKLSSHPILKNNIEEMIKEKSMQLDPNTSTATYPFGPIETAASSRPAS